MTRDVTQPTKIHLQSDADFMDQIHGHGFNAQM